MQAPTSSSVTGGYDRAIEAGDRGGRLAGRQVVQNDGNHHTGPPHTRPPPANGRIDRDALFPIIVHSPNSTTLAAIRKAPLHAANPPNSLPQTLPHKRDHVRACIADQKATESSIVTPMPVVVAICAGERRTCPPHNIKSVHTN